MRRPITDLIVDDAIRSVLELNGLSTEQDGLYEDYTDWKSHTIAEHIRTVYKLGKGQHD